MRKKLFVGLILVLTLLVSCIGFFACDCGGDDKTIVVVDDSAAEIVYYAPGTITKTGSVYSAELPSDFGSTIDVENLFRVSTHATWTIFKVLDNEPEQEVPKNAVPVDEGLNVFKIKVVSGDGSNTKEYRVEITKKPTQVTVSFNTDGGSTVADQKIDKNTAATKPNDPSKTGYEFDNWYYNNVVFNFDTIIESDITLNAKWTPTVYTITYYGVDGATNNNPSTYTIETETFTLADPVKDGYTFTGWDNNKVITKGSTGNKSFTASWSSAEYTITYHGVDGATNPNPTGYSYSANAITLAAPSKTGYDFVSWSDGGVIPANSTGNKEFTATWTPTVYTITYYGVEDATNNNPSTYTIESGLIQLTAPSKTGYNFVSWSNGGTIPANSTGNKSFTASWTATEYNITYHDVEGAINSNPSKYSYSATNALTLSEPTKDGYTFTGWSDGGVIPAGSTGSKEFTANWQINTYSITYVLNGGTIAEGANPTSYTIETPTFQLADPNKNDDTFLGWFIGDTKVTQITKGNTGNKTIVAKWENVQIFTITYVGVENAVNNNPSFYTTSASAITLNDPEWEGYTFTGWSEGNTIPAGSTGNKTFTANWDYTAYTITYNGVEDATHSNPTTYNIASATITLADPDKDGYEFKGWYEGNVKVTQITTGSTGNRILTATWEIIEYTITYHGVEGAINENPTKYTIESATINFAAPSKDGYTFVSWSIPNIYKGNTGNIATTASWTLTEYAITYYGVDGATNTNPTKYTIESGLITLTAPSKTGYNFVSWSNDGVIPANSTGAKSFTATWSAIEYSITYYGVDGATNTNPAKYTIESGLITLAAPTKTGYNFVSWSDGGVIPANSTGNKEFTASWQAAEYTITYYGVEGATNNNPTGYSYSATDAITLTAPSKTGYNFVSWSDNGVIPAGSTGNKSFTATWSAIEYTITYHGVDGATNTNPAKYTIESGLITLAAPSKTGYNFVSWSDGGVIPANSTGNKEFTASWTAIEYTITYYGVEGATNNNRTTYTIETDTFTLSNPSKEGYTFTGWDKNATITKGSTGNKEFTASWEKDAASVYNITYANVNGATNNNPATYTEGDEFNFAPLTGRDGYVFTGWSVTGITPATTGNVTTTANWEAIFTVSNNSITGLTNYGKTLNEVTVPASIDGANITGIGQYAFENGTFTKITLPSNITLIDSSAFKNCDLANVYYNGTIAGWCAITFGDKYANPVSYADNLYINNSLVTGTVTIPASVTSVGNYAFYGYAPISALSFASNGSLTSIGDYAFYGCINLATVNFPTAFDQDRIGLYAFYGTLFTVEYTYVDSSNNNVQYVVLMLNNTSCANIESYLTTMKSLYGEINGSASNERMYAFGVSGPFVLSNTVATIKGDVDLCFELAEKYNIPVYFQMNNCDYYLSATDEDNCAHVSSITGDIYTHFYNDPDMVEWVSLPDESTGEKWGGANNGAIPRIMTGASTATDYGFPCFNSESYLAWYDKQITDGFIAPLIENLKHLKNNNKEYLFAGVSTGETYIPNYSTDAVVTSGNNYSAIRSYEKAQYGMHAIYNITDDYGNKLYPNYTLLDLAAERFGMSRAAYIRYLLFQVVHDYIEHTCELFYNAGISRYKIFSHTSALASYNGGDEFSSGNGYYVDSKCDSVALPTWVAVNDYCVPGYTMVSGQHNAANIGNSVAKYANGLNAYANVQSYVSDAGNNQSACSTYVQSLLGGNSKLLTIFNYDNGYNKDASYYYTTVIKQWLNKQILASYSFGNRAALTYPEYPANPGNVFPMGAIGGVAYGTNTSWTYYSPSEGRNFYVQGGNAGTEFTFALKDAQPISGYNNIVQIHFGYDASNPGTFSIPLMVNGDTGYIHAGFIIDSISSEMLVSYTAPNAMFAPHSTSEYTIFKLAFKKVDGVWKILINGAVLDEVHLNNYITGGGTFMNAAYQTNVRIETVATVNVAMLSSSGYYSDDDGTTTDLSNIKQGQTYNYYSHMGALLPAGAYGFNFNLGIKLNEAIPAGYYQNVTISLGPTAELTSAFRIVIMINGDNQGLYYQYGTTPLSEYYPISGVTLSTTDYGSFNFAVVKTTSGVWQIRINGTAIDGGTFNSFGFVDGTGSCNITIENSGTATLIVDGNATSVTSKSNTVKVADFGMNASAIDDGGSGGGGGGETTTQVNATVLSDSVNNWSYGDKDGAGTTSVQAGATGVKYTVTFNNTYGKQAVGTYGYFDILFSPANDNGQGAAVPWVGLPSWSANQYGIRIMVNSDAEAGGVLFVLPINNAGNVLDGYTGSWTPIAIYNYGGSISFDIQITYSASGWSLIVGGADLSADLSAWFNPTPSIANGSSQTNIAFSKVNGGAIYGNVVLTSYTKI